MELPGSCSMLGTAVVPTAAATLQCLPKSSISLKQQQRLRGMQSQPSYPIFPTSSEFEDSALCTAEQGQQQLIWGGVSMHGQYGPHLLKDRPQ